MTDSDMPDGKDVVRGALSAAQFTARPAAAQPATGPAWQASDGSSDYGSHFRDSLAKVASSTAEQAPADGSPGFGPGDGYASGSGIAF